MVILTNERQWRLGLGMFIADLSSDANTLMRQFGIDLLSTNQVVPPAWKKRIQTYLEQREARKALLQHEE